MTNESLDWIEYELVNEDYAGAAQRIANRVRMRGDWIVRTNDLPEHDSERLCWALASMGFESEIEDGWLTVGLVQAERFGAVTIEEPTVPMMQLVFGGDR